ncbi:Berbamunine synthase [Vitis vinifera]|uniref:Berbamunine synthase n=1 Tax=Vitis vinifera TaxID=29760 RepID=A0A438CYZ5_VITVI|nr:Berbamunine synthase [Vitis vinifera]
MATYTITADISLFSFLYPLLLLPFLLIFKHIFLKSPPLPPGPYPWPIIGNLLQMGGNLHVKLANLAKRHGPLMSLRLGTQIMVVASSSAAAMEVLKTHDRTLSGRYRLEESESYLPDGAVFRQSNGVSCGVEGEEGDGIGGVFGKKGRDVRGVLLKDLLNENAELGATDILDFYPILGGLDIQGIRKKLKEIFRRIPTTWEDILKERRKQRIHGSSHGDFLDALLETGFEDDQINHVIMELFFAGPETSSLTVEWAMAELIKNQDAMHKLCNELTQIIGESPRSRDLEDPLSFKPERFLDSKLEFKGNDFEYIPFGAGRRMCPGMPLAARLVPMILATFVRLFDWSTPGDMDFAEIDMEERFVITLRKEQPLRLDYWGLVENGIPAAAEGVVLIDAQRKNIDDQKLKDLKTKNYLFQALNRSILETVLKKDTTKNIWDSLK